jgi:large repetitive protein
VGDLNGDGKLDMVITRDGSNKVTVLLGIGDGHFAQGTDVAAGTQPASVQIGDLNGDGRPDLVVTNRTTGTITVLFGNGDGTFAKPTQCSAVTDAVNVVIGDFGGKGKIDLAVAGASSQTVAVLLNDGSGHFAKAVPYNIGHQPQSLTVADLNGSGHSDIISANSDGTVSTLLGADNGNFRSGRSTTVTSFALSGVAAADFNGDGKIDVAVTHSGSNQLTVLLGRGDGAFQPGVAYTVGNDPASVIAADVDGDGVPDLITVNQAGNTFSVLTGNGDGTFKSPLDFTVGNSPRAVATGDFNGDGHLDLAILNYADGTVSVPLGNGDGTFQAARAYRADLERKAIAAGDLDGNGIPDLVVTNYCGNDLSCKSNGTATVFLANGDGTYRTAASYQLGNGPVSVALADVNGDGKLDLIALNRTDKSYTVIQGNGDGTFGEPLTYPLGKSPLALVVGDFNKDGKVDLAISSDCGLSSCTQPGEVDILLGRGDGSFIPGATYPVGYSPSSLALADLNGSGRPDLVIANACGEDNTCKSHGTATLLAGNGTGKFTQTNEIDIGFSPSSIAIDSLSGSGTDLIVASRTSNRVSVFHSDGKGGFKSPAIYPVGSAPSSLVIADFDGDGKKDVAVANFQASTVSILFGHGDGTLEPATSYSVGTGPESLVAVSVKKAGASSLVSANGNSGSSPMGTDITVLANMQPADVSAAAVITTTLGLSSSENPSMEGGQVTFTATVTPTAATGNVTFVDASNSNAPLSCSPQPLISGKATCSTTLLSPGSHNIRADYAGNSTYGPSHNYVNPQVVLIPTKTTLSPTSGSSVVNQSVTFTATVAPTSGTGTPTGSVTFVDTSTNPTALNCKSQPLTNGVATCSTSLLTAGIHTIQATYNGDSIYGVSPPSNTATQTVTQATATVNFSSSPSSSTVNGAVAFTAIVKIPPGQVALSSSSTVKFTENGAPLAGCTVVWNPATATATCSTDRLTAGSDTIVATLTDPNFTGTGNTTQQVGPYTGTLSLSSPASSTVNATVSFTATAAPTGKPVPLSGTMVITDTNASNVTSLICSMLVNVSTGIATCSTNKLVLGSYTITATYTDTNYSTTPQTKTFTVGPATTSTTVTSSTNNMSSVNQSVMFTATVAYPSGVAQLSGVVTFTDNGGAIICMSPSWNPTTGVATCTTTSLDAAHSPHKITATYNASNSDKNFASSSGSLTQTVKATPTTTAVKSSSTANTSDVNDSVTFTATVTPMNNLYAPVPLAGVVTFTDNNAPITCTSPTWNPSTGVATCTINTLTATMSPHNIVATYNANNSDKNFASSSGSVTQTVKATPTTTVLKSSSTANTSDVNDSVTFTATVTPMNNHYAPVSLAGVVTFSDNNAPITCTSPTWNPSTGVATCTINTLTASSHNITATYNANNSDKNFASSSGSVTQTVKATPTTTAVKSSSTGNTSDVNDSVTFTATVTPMNNLYTPIPLTGIVTFADGKAPITCTSPTWNPSTGVATCTINSLTASMSPHNITATYNANNSDQNFTSSSGSVIQTVKATPTTTVVKSSSTGNTSDVNDSVTFTATVTPSNNLYAPVQLSGTVTFTNNNASIKCTSPTWNPSTGVATCTINSLTASTSPHNIRATYNANNTDQNFVISSGSVSQTVNATPTTTAVKSSSTGNTSNVNDAITFTATVTPSNGLYTPVQLSGAVTFTNNKAPITCTSPTWNSSTGVATCTINTLIASSHNITATYNLNNSDTNFVSSSGSVTQIVDKASSSVTLGSTAGASASGQSVTYTATVTPTGMPVPLSGTVAFTDNGNAIGCPAVKADPTTGIATCTTSAVIAGPSAHSIVATYSDPNYTTAMSSPINIAPMLTLISGATVNNTSPVDFLFTTLGANKAYLECVNGYVSPGHTTVPLNTIPIVCSVPPSVTPAAPGQSTTVTVTVNTTGTATAQLTGRTNLFLAAVFGFPLFFLIRRSGAKRPLGKTFVQLLGVLALALLVAQGIGCGGSFTPPKTTSGGVTPPGVYFLQVAASPDQNFNTITNYAIVPVTVNR